MIATMDTYKIRTSAIIDSTVNFSSREMRLPDGEVTHLAELYRTCKLSPYGRPRKYCVGFNVDISHKDRVVS